MAVSVITPNEKPKQDPLDLVLKGLQIAGSVYGIKEAQAKLEQIDKSNAELEGKKQGVATPMERAVLLEKGYKVGDANTPGAQKFIASEDQSPVYFQPPRPKTELAIPNYEPYRDSRGQNRIGIKGPTGLIMTPNDPLAANQPKDANDKSVAQADDLRTYRDKHEITKTTNALSQSYNKMQAAAAQPSAAGDMKMIYNFMKMQDPGSTVREGEYASAQNARGVPDSILNTYNAILDGTRLTTEQRADFLKQAGDDWDNQRQNQMALDQQILAIAKKRGLSAEDVVLNVYDLKTPAGSKTKNENISGNNLPAPPSRDDILKELNKRVQTGQIKVDMRTPEQQAAGLNQLQKNSSKVGQK